MVDNAYPDWEPKQRLEMVQNQFIQGVVSAAIQLVLLMQEKPKTVDEALELAQLQLTVETAQRQLHRLLEQYVHSFELQTEEELEVNAVHCSEATAGSMKLEELSRQVQCLSTKLAWLQTDSGHHQTAHECSKPSSRAPICWNCNERGHL